MLGSLTGNIIFIQPPQIILDVHGIGYEINLPISEFDYLSISDKIILIYTHLVIREDAHTLYGFTQQSNRECFRNIIKVSGIGPKIALAILSTLTVNEIYLALHNNDITTLCRVPGVGKKVAERMILELTGKINYPMKIDTRTNQIHDNIKSDTVQALLNLGYNEKAIYKVLNSISTEHNTIESMIKECLKLLN